MKFDYCIGNPPYQEETGKLKENFTNGQTPKKNIFQYFQQSADEITALESILIYPAGRWIQRSGKGMKEFGFTQINDIHLSKLMVYPNSRDIFPSVDIPDGVSIVIKDKKKRKNSFVYQYYDKKDNPQEIQIECPGDKVLPLNPRNTVIVRKSYEFIKSNKIDSMNSNILPRTLFGVESSFVEDNPNKVKEYSSSSEIDFNTEVKLFTNDRAGKAGRGKWFVTSINTIPKNKSLLGKWKVVVSSANAGGQKRDRQLEILDNHSAFGRSRVALRLFDSYEEAYNFYEYVESNIVKFLFLMTDESLTTLGKAVPDILDYTNNSKFIDFKKNIDKQLQQLIGLTDIEMQYIEEKIYAKEGKRK